MNVDDLHTFEAHAAVQQRSAEANEPHAAAMTGPWGVPAAVIIESVGRLVGRLARSAAAHPDSPPVARQEAADVLLDAAHLYEMLMAGPACAAEEYTGMKPDGTVVAWECDRRPHSSGEHAAHPLARQVEEDASALLDHAIRLSVGVRSALLRSDELDSNTRADLVGAVAKLRRQLDWTEEQLGRLATS